MYSSLEVIYLDDFIAVFTHPAGFRHLAEAGLRTAQPLLVPAGMEVFPGEAELRHFQWDTIGAERSMTSAVDSGFRVQGVTRFGENTPHRLLGAYTVRGFAAIPGSSDFVLADVVTAAPDNEPLKLLFPAALVGRFELGAVVWGVFDRVADITDVATEQVTSSRHPNLIFRLVLALSRGDKDLWQLMLELGESATTIIGAVELAVADGYRVRGVGPAPMRYQLFEPPFRRTHADPESVTGMGGRNVRGVPMDEDAYHALLAILDRVSITPGLIDDEELMAQAAHIFRLVSAAAPRRVLAKHAGLSGPAPTPGTAAIDWADLSGWLAEQPPFEDERMLLLHPGQPVDAQLVANLHRACEDYALLRVETDAGRQQVVEARKMGFNWRVERVLRGVDRASNERVSLRLSALTQVEVLGLPWYR